MIDLIQQQMNNDTKPKKKTNQRMKNCFVDIKNQPVSCAS